MILINDDDEGMKTMLMKLSTVTGGVQRREHTVEPKPKASSAQKFFLCQKASMNRKMDPYPTWKTRKYEPQSPYASEKMASKQVKALKINQLRLKFA